ncbi:MAG: lyase [Gammaproteobacteria bacterium]
MSLRALLAVLLLSVPLSPATALAQTGEVREWKVPWPDSRPRDPFTLDGRSVWFCGQVGHYLAKLDTVSGEFSKVALPDLAGPHNLVIDRQGIAWFAGNLQAYIGRLDPASGAIEKIPMPEPAARDPHTLAFDSRGDIWFTVQAGNFIGRLRVADRKVDLVSVPTPLARPYGILVSADDTVWAVLFGTNKLASIDPRTLELTEIGLPREDARPRRIGITTDGRIWYTDHAGGHLGAYSPQTGDISEWELPGGPGAQPYAMAVDDADRVWVVETGSSPNRFVGFDSASESFLGSTAVPSGGGSVRHMQFHAETGAIWFGTDANTIGRFTPPPR